MVKVCDFPEQLNTHIDNLLQKVCGSSLESIRLNIAPQWLTFALDTGVHYKNSSFIKSLVEFHSKLPLALSSNAYELGQITEKCARVRVLFKDRLAKLAAELKLFGDECANLEHVLVAVKTDDGGKAVANITKRLEKDKKEFVEGSVHSTLSKFFNGMPKVAVEVEAVAGATADAVVAVVEAPAATAKKRGATATTGTPKAGAKSKKQKNGQNGE